MEKGRYLHDFKEASFRPSSIGADSSEGGREGAGRANVRRTRRGSFVPLARTTVGPTFLPLVSASFSSSSFSVVVVVRHLTQISRKRHI